MENKTTSPTRLIQIALEWLNVTKILVYPDLASFERFLLSSLANGCNSQVALHLRLVDAVDGYPSEVATLKMK